MSSTLDVGTLRATLELAHEQFDGDLDRAQASFRQLGNTAETQGRRVTGSFSGVGRGVQQETSRAEQAVQRLGQSGEQHGRRLGQGIQQGAASGMRGIAGQIGTAGTQAGSAAGAGIEGGMAARLARLGAAGGPVGLAIAGVAMVGAAVGKALADNIIAGMEKQALANRDRAKFGWTEQQAAEAGKAAADSYTKGWGDSVADNRAAAGSAIQAGLIDGNATAEQIQPVIDKLGVLNKIGFESAEATRAAGQMVRTGMAKDAAEALDLITAAQQHGLNVSGDLLDTITEYGTQFRKLGFDGATALGLVSQMTQAGARDTDVAADALKEFSIRAVDGSKDTVAAFEMLGFGADDIATRFAKGGQTARDAFQEVVGKIQGIQDPLVRAQVETKLFGTQAEDLGAALNGIDVSSAAAQLGTIEGAAQRAGETMGGASADIESAKRSIAVSMDNVQVKLAEAFGPSLAKAAQWVSEHTEEISRAFEIAGGTLGMVGAAVGMIGGTIVGVIGEIIEQSGKLLRLGLSPLFSAMESVGGMMAKLPGTAGEIGRSLQSQASVGREMVDTWVHAGEKMSDFGWDVMRASNSVGLASADIAKGTEKAKTATEAFQALGVKVREVPDEKRIVIEDNSPEVQQKLKDLGIEVKTLPDGSVYIDAQDEDAKAKIAELTKPEVKTIVVTTTQAKVGEELSAVNERRVAMGMKPLTAEEFGTGSAGSGVGGTGLGTQGQKITVKVTGGPATAKPNTPTQIQRTTAEKDDDAKAADKAAKAAEAARKKEEAAKAKAEKEQAAAAKKASDAQAKIPGLERALAIAEQKVRELKPNTSAASRMSAEESVTKAREALEKARTDAQGATTTTTTGSDGKPVTVTGDGKGGTVQVGTGGNPLQVEPANSAQGDGMRVFVTNMPAGGVGGGVKLSLFANGGVEDHRAQIARGGDMRVWAEPETGGEAYVPLGLSKRAGSMAIMHQVAARFGKRLVPFENGGITPNPGVTGGTVALGNISADGITTQGQQDAWDAIRQQFPGLSLTSATRTAQTEGHADFHNAGQAIDISGSDADELAAAEWIARTYPNSRELIHSEGFQHNIKDGKDVGDGVAFYGAGQMADHANHVHWTPPAGFTFGAGGSNGGVTGLDDGVTATLPGVGNLTANSTPKEIAAAIIGEAKKRGYTDDEARAILATAMQESDLKMQDGGGGKWKGIFQQDGSYEGRDDPNTNISGFLDRLDEKRKIAPGGDIWKDIFWLQQRPGESSADAAYANGRQDYLSEIRSKLDPADSLMREVLASAPTAPSAGNPTATDKPTTGLGNGGVVDVRVTNWPSQLGGGSGVKFSLFANGGIEDHAPQIARAGDMRVWAEPETGGEAYIPLGPSKRPRSIALWHETGRRLGVTGYAAGGINLPKIEAPKIAPTLGPGMALPLSGATPAAAAPSSPLETLGIGVGNSQADYTQQRLTKLGVDLFGIAKDAAIQTLVPGGTLPAPITNSIALMKSIGSGLEASSRNQATTSETSTSTKDGGQTVNNYNTTINATNTDDAFRQWQIKQNRDAAAFEGKIP